MIKQADIVAKNNHFIVSGDLNFNTVMFVYQKSLSQIQQFPEIEIDLSEVKSSDSSGLALILEWIKFANLNDQKIKITHIPSYLITIAQAARIDKLVSST